MVTTATHEEEEYDRGMEIMVEEEERVISSKIKWKRYKCECGNESFYECSKKMRQIPTGFKHLTRDAYNGHTHTGNWHFDYSSCNWIKCAWGLGINKIGQQHWSCCFDTDPNSICKYNKDVGYIEHAPIYNPPHPREFSK